MATPQERLTLCARWCEKIGGSDHMTEVGMKVLRAVGRFLQTMITGFSIVLFVIFVVWLAYTFLR